jgi:predicted nucleotidyltransferase
MRRRYAILDDNQTVLEHQVAALRGVLPSLIGSRCSAAMVIGSVADGRARDGSDIDLVVVLREGLPARSDYRWWDTEVAPALEARSRFPVQPLILGRASLGTSEPHLARALSIGIVLWDPEELFHDQPEAQP